MVREALAARRHRPGRPGRRRHHQPAGDHPGLGPATPAGRCANADRLAGHPHRRRCCASWPATYGEDRFRGPHRPAAGHLLRRARSCAGCSTHVDGLRERAERGEVLFGTMDSWLIWKLTGRHVTDVTNASRTMLMNLRTLDWDAGAARRAGRPGRRCCRRSAAPPRSTARPPGALAGVPVASALGDQQAALFGQTCFAAGRGQVHLRHRQLPAAQHRRRARSPSTHGLLTTVGLPDRRPARRCTRWRASIAVTGSLVQWLRDNLGLISTAAGDRGAGPRRVDDNGGCYVVPAFSGPVRAALALRRPRA